MYPEVEYATADSPLVSDEIYKQYDLVLFSRVIYEVEKTSARLNKLGIPFALDLDDYWFLPEEHLLYKHYTTNGVSKRIIDSVKAAHFVTCTTEILASKIRELNPNVYILPNGIDAEDPVWFPSKIESKRIRFGFTQGETHAPDIQLVAKDVARSFSSPSFYNRAQIALAGFRLQTERLTTMSGTKNVQTSVQIAYERMLTNDLKAILDKQYVFDLMKLEKPDGTNKPYRRIWSKEVGQFGTVYDEIDVSVVPLKDSEFNSCKSNIKMLEAGFKDCAVMVSEISPYTPLATKANSFLLSEKSFFEWQRFILTNPSIIEDKKEQLKEDVQKYSLQNLSKERKEVYESCICV